MINMDDLHGNTQPMIRSLGGDTTLTFDHLSLAKDFLTTSVHILGRMVGFRQGTLTRWKSIVNRKVTWPDLWRNDVDIKFLIRSVYDTLPSPMTL